MCNLRAFILNIGTPLVQHDVAGHEKPHGSDLECHLLRRNLLMAQYKGLVSCLIAKYCVGGAQVEPHKLRTGNVDYSNDWDSMVQSKSTTLFHANAGRFRNLDTVGTRIKTEGWQWLKGHGHTAFARGRRGTCQIKSQNSPKDACCVSSQSIRLSRSWVTGLRFKCPYQNLIAEP